MKVGWSRVATTLTLFQLRGSFKYYLQQEYCIVLLKCEV